MTIGLVLAGLELELGVVLVFVHAVTTRPSATAAVTVLNRAPDIASLPLEPPRSAAPIAAPCKPLQPGMLGPGKGPCQTFPPTRTGVRAKRSTVERSTRER